MKTFANILSGIIVICLFGVFGYYGTHALWWLVNYFGIETWAIFVGIVSALQALGVLVNSRVER